MNPPEVLQVAEIPAEAEEVTFHIQVSSIPTRPITPMREDSGRGKRGERSSITKDMVEVTAI